MKRRAFITLLGGAAAAATCPLAVRAQQQGKLPVVGVLVSASPPHPFADALRRGLQNLGYSEGRNIALEVRYSEGRSDRAAEIATEFVRLGVDVIVAHFTPAVRAALGATQTSAALTASAGALTRSLGSAACFGSAGLRSPQITSSPRSIQARPSVAPTDPAPMIAIRMTTSIAIDHCVTDITTSSRFFDHYRFV